MCCRVSGAEVLVFADDCDDAYDDEDLINRERYDAVLGLRYRLGVMVI